MELFAMNAGPVKIVKFGGSSLADAEHFRQVQNIITADPSRRYAVPSAPGKRYDGDIKVTDMLYHCYNLASEGEDFSDAFAKIEKRYQDIIRDLGLDLDVSNEFETIADFTVLSCVIIINLFNR